VTSDPSDKLSRRKIVKGIAGLSAAGLIGASATVCSRRDKIEAGRNIVMICVDDLNDYPSYLGGYQGQAQTPNLDALAASGRAYKSAHCCVPICRPSRSSVLLGQKPWQKLPSNPKAAEKTNSNSSFWSWGRYHQAVEQGDILSLPKLI
jgi:hypothetical protein